MSKKEQDLKQELELEQEQDLSMVESFAHQQINVIYLRGLNSHGDDQLRFGRFTFGEMAGPWSKNLQALGLRVTVLKGFGAGPLAEQISNARQLLLASEVWQSGAPLHLLGHSTGGLIARALVHSMPDSGRFVTLTSLGSPHRGTSLASLIQDLPSRRPVLNYFLRSIRYDIQKKIPSFIDLKPEAMTTFNEKYVDLPNIKYLCALFSLPFSQMTFPLKAVGQWVDPNETLGESDGLVQRQSQVWGEVFYEAPLDHLEQIGYFPRLDLNLRHQQKNYFSHLINNYVKQIARAR